jgi:putative SOS response-associated peptidase YedK
MITGTTGKPIKAAAWFRITGEEPRPPFAFASLMRRWNWEKDGLRRKSDQELMDTDAQVIAMAFLTCEPNGVVAPIHPKAMPVLLTSQDQFDTWLSGSGEEAAALQRPLANDAIEIAFTGQKQDPRLGS